MPDLRSQLTHSAITGLASLHIGLEYNGSTVNASIFASALNLPQQPAPRACLPPSPSATSASGCGSCWV